MGCDNKDLITPVGVLPDGRTIVSRHRPDHSVGMATIRPAREGSPMAPGEEIVTTRQRDDGSVEVVDSYAHCAQPRSGPVRSTGGNAGLTRLWLFVTQSAHDVHQIGRRLFPNEGPVQVAKILGDSELNVATQAYDIVFAFVIVGRRFRRH